MPKLTISRTSEYQNRLRAIRIRVNGSEIGRIANAEILDFDLPIGIHEIQAKIDWCGSNTVTLEMNKEQEVALQLSSGNGFPLFNILFRQRKYLKLEVYDLEEVL